MTLQQRGFLHLATGFTIWLVLLGVLYGAQATGCAFGWQNVLLGPVSLLRFILIGLVLCHAALLVWIFVYSRNMLSAVGSTLSSFLWRGALYLTLAAMVSTLWISAAILVPSIC